MYTFRFKLQLDDIFSVYFGHQWEMCC